MTIPLTPFEVFNCVMAGLFLGLFVGIIVGIKIGKMINDSAIEDYEDTNCMLSNEIVNESNIIKAYRKKYGYCEEAENNKEIDGGNE